MKEGYVFFIRAYATSQNQTFAGFVKVTDGLSFDSQIV